jgi:vitamin-K-epoxide reductase (warfarin-sensitive)
MKGDMDRKKWVIILCVLGVLVAGYLGYMYYTDTHSVCDINATFACTPVHESDFALFLGIPVAILGLVGYLLIMVFAMFQFKYVKWIALLGALFSLRLTWAEFFVIHAFCVFCLVSQVLIIAIFLISVKWKRFKRN